MPARKKLCDGKKKDGGLCSNYAMEGSNCCYQHQKQCTGTVYYKESGKPGVMSNITVRNASVIHATVPPVGNLADTLLPPGGMIDLGGGPGYSGPTFEENLRIIEGSRTSASNASSYVEQCHGMTKKGQRCLNNARQNSNCCKIHQDQCSSYGRAQEINENEPRYTNPGQIGGNRYQ